MALSEAYVKRKGLEISDDIPDELPDEGWDYHPGKARLDSFEPDYKKYSPEAKAALKEAMKGKPKP